MIVIIVIVALFLRLMNLGQSLWLDEAITAQAVRNLSFTELITRFAPGDFHPPLYYLFLKAWGSMVGFNEIALRLPSVLFSLATVFLLYQIGKAVWTKRTGLIAALFYAVNPLAIYYSQEARMYSLETLLLSVSVWAFIKKRWALFTVFYCLTLYTDYLPLLMVPVFILASSDRKKFLMRILPLVFLGFLPWLPMLVRQLLLAQHSLGVTPEWKSVLGAFDLKAAPLTFVKFIIGRITLDNKFLYAASMISIGALYGFILIRARSRLIWTWLLVPLFLGIAISFVIPLYSYFRFLFVLPAFCLLLGRGVRNSKVLALAIVVISSLSLLVFNLSPRFQREGWREAVTYMRIHPGVVIMPSTAQSAPLQYYAFPFRITDTVEPNYGKNVYLLRYVQEIFDPKDTLRLSLEKEGYTVTRLHDFNNVIIWEYENRN